MAPNHLREVNFLVQSHPIHGCPDAESEFKNKARQVEKALLKFVVYKLYPSYMFVATHVLQCVRI